MIESAFAVQKSAPDAEEGRHARQEQLQARPLNILLYEAGSGYGGSSVSLSRIVKFLDRRKYTPFVLSHGIGPRLASLQTAGIDVQTLTFTYPFAQSKSRKNSFLFYTNFFTNALCNATRIARVIRKQAIGLVHLNNGIHDCFPGLLAARIARIPCISHIRGTEELTRLERRFGHWLRMSVTLNSYMQQLYAEAFGSDKVCLIFNGVDLDAYESVAPGKLRTEYGIDGDHFLVGTVARIVPGKGIPELLTAATKALQKVPTLRIAVVGDDPYGGKYESEQKLLARRLGIDKKVVFTGWRDDIPSVVADFDVLAQVSTYPEGMSLTPIEAMALAKPVICTDVPGLADTVVDGETGFIVPKGDTNLLADRIIAMARDRDQTRCMGLAGRQRAYAHFDVRRTVKQIESLYDRFAQFNMVHA